MNTSRNVAVAATALVLLGVFTASAHAQEPCHTPDSTASLSAAVEPPLLGAVPLPVPSLDTGVIRFTWDDDIGNQYLACADVQIYGPVG